MSAIRTTGLTKRYGDTLALEDSTSRSTRARCTATSGPTAPARRRRSGCCWACTARRAGGPSCSAWMPGPIPSRAPPRGLRLRRAVSVAVDDERRDARVPRPPARRHRRGLPRRARASASAWTRTRRSGRCRRATARRSSSSRRSRRGRTCCCSTSRRAAWIRSWRWPSASASPRPASAGSRSSCRRTSSARWRRCATASASSAPAGSSTRARWPSCATSASRPSRSRSPAALRRCRRCPACRCVPAGPGALRFEVAGTIGPLIAALAEHPVATLTSREPSLEEIFLHHYR